MMQKTSRRIVKILGVGVVGTNLAEVLARLERKLLSGSRTKFLVVTPNPEIVLLAQKDKKLAMILNKADISVPDGVGLKLFGDWKLKIIHGRVLFGKLVKLADKRKFKIFLLGGEEGVAGEVSRVLKKEHKNLKIEYTSGPKLDNNAKPIDNSQLDIQKHTLEKINSFAPDILFVGFGAPKQEKWMWDYLSKLNVGCAMAVGGTFDYYAGRFPLPPKWAEKLELEWVWRLATQKDRITRVFNAAVVFPLKVLGEKLK